MKYLLKLLVCYFIYQHSFAQNNTDTSLKAVAQNLISGIISSDKEKAFIITDRTVYYAGETVYFKAFLIDSVRNYLQTVPLKLYVDCIDDKDRIISQLILDNADLRTAGRFMLPDSLPEKYYWLRTYTNKMVSGNLNNIGIVPIYVVNKNNIVKTSVNKTKQNENSKPVLHLYPEGGSIISGLNSTVAVSLKDNEGNPLVASGIVKDKLDSTIATFYTNEYGLAKFSFFPKWFDKYTVSVKNNEASATLPKVNFFAGQITVTKQAADYITVRIALEDSIYSKDYITYLVAASGDNLCFTSVGKGMYNVDIPTSKFPGGIATLYLFNQNSELLSSRNVYVNKRYFYLTLQTDKENYAARHKIKLSLKLTDPNNKPEAGVFSLSVADKNMVDTSLTFLHIDTLQNLSADNADLVMLTQTNTNPLQSNQNNNTVFDNDTDFSLSGKVLDAEDVPIDNSVLTVLSNQANPIIETDTTDKKGRFKFHLPGFPDHTLFTLQLNDLAGKSIPTYKIVFDLNNSFHFTTPSKLKTISALDKNLPKLKAQLVTIDSLNIVSNKEFLKPVIVKTYVKGTADFDTTKRISHLSHIITASMIGNGPGMAGNALLNVPGLRLVSGYLIVSAPNGISGITAADEPLIVMDGVDINPAQAYTDNQGSPVINFLNSLPVQTIDFIEVLNGPEAANFGVEGARGVIVVNTTTRLNNSLATTKGLKTFYAKGFYNDAPFDAPDYSDKQTLKSKLPDLRKTIYWNGNIVTNKNGEVTVEFYAADLSATYIGTISGVTSNGDRIYQTITINRLNQVNR